MALLEFIKTLFSINEHTDNSNIEFTRVDSDTVAIKEVEKTVEQINIRTFTISQINEIRKADSILN